MEGSAERTKQRQSWGREAVCGVVEEQGRWTGEGRRGSALLTRGSRCHASELTRCLVATRDGGSASASGKKNRVTGLEVVTGVNCFMCQCREVRSGWVLF